LKHLFYFCTSPKLIREADRVRKIALALLDGRASQGDFAHPTFRCLQIYF
jgi:hypothetical protein